MIDYLRKEGYGVFKLENDGLGVLEEERVAELKSLGYKIEHYKDALVKVDPNLITSEDDIVLYFYERLKRSKYPLLVPKKLRSYKDRAIERSVVNTLLQWRIREGRISLKQALEEIFIMIDILFDKADQFGVIPSSLNILSINHNKPLVFELLREVHKKQDRDMQYKVSQIIKKDDINNYFCLLEKAREEMQSSTEETKPKGNKRREVKG